MIEKPPTLWHQQRKLLAWLAEGERDHPIRHFPRSKQGSYRRTLNTLVTRGYAVRKDGALGHTWRITPAGRAWLKGMEQWEATKAKQDRFLYPVQVTRPRQGLWSNQG